MHGRLRPVGRVGGRGPRARSGEFRGDENWWQLRVAAARAGEIRLNLACGARWRSARELEEVWPGSSQKLLVTVAPQPICFPIPGPHKIIPAQVVVRTR